MGIAMTMTTEWFVGYFWCGSSDWWGGRTHRGICFYFSFACLPFFAFAFWSWPYAMTRAVLRPFSFLSSVLWLSWGRRFPGNCSRKWFVMLIVGLKGYPLSLLSSFWELFICLLVSSEVPKWFFSTTRLGSWPWIIPFFFTFLAILSPQFQYSDPFISWRCPIFTTRSVQIHTVRMSPLFFPFLRPPGGTTTRCMDGPLLTLQHCISVFWKNPVMKKSIEINSSRTITKRHETPKFFSFFVYLDRFPCNLDTFEANHNIVGMTTFI